MSVEIRVRGSHTTAAAPQEGTVHATLSGEGPAAEPVFGAVSRKFAEVRASVETLHDAERGPVTRYAIDQIRMAAHRPWNSEGAQLPPVHTATVSIVVTFIDFDELARWVAWTVGVDGLSVGYIDWALTRARRLDVERKTRRKAVRDAKRRAQDYADALELGPVQVRSISDPGVGAAPLRKVMMASSVAASPGGTPEFALRPEDVEIVAEVEATFAV